jgi:hypothetical protein
MALLEYLESVQHITRSAHILFGSAGLILFCIPLLSAKGQKTHKQFGRMFEIVGWITVTLAGYGVLSYLLRFALSDFVLSERLSEYSLILMFGSLTLTAAAMLHQGRVCLRHKHAFEAARTPIYIALHLALLVASIALFIFALLFRPPSIIVMFIATVYGIAVVNDGYQYVKPKAFQPDTWVQAHINGMMGTGLAFWVAFGIFGSKRIFSTDTQLAGWVNALPWIISGMIIIPLMIYWKRKARRMFVVKTETAS